MISNRELFRKYLAQTSDAPAGLEIARAKGSYLFSSDGKKFLDLISGISVSNLGHANWQVKNAIIKQLNEHLHLMVYGEYIQSAQVKLAEKLVSLLPQALDNVYFTNSGSEAVEGALKLAKRATGRTEIIAFHNAYHGHTQGAMSIMGNEQWKMKFRPLLPGVRFISFNDFEDLQQISTHTACVIIEPVQGEAGVITPAEGYLKALREKCDDASTLLIFDEVQTGMGRTGELFACVKYGVVPDILVLAKALGAGMPLGAFIAGRDLMKNLSHHPKLGHITTFGGHPVSCAAALAGLDFLLVNNLIGGVQNKADLFVKLLGNCSGIQEIRHSGLLMAVELGDENKVQLVIKNSIQRGVISDWFLFRPTALRIAPPLTITEEEITLACRVIGSEIDSL